MMTHGRSLFHHQRLKSNLSSTSTPYGCTYNCIVNCAKRMDGNQQYGYGTSIVVTGSMVDFNLRLPKAEEISRAAKED